MPTNLKRYQTQGHYHFITFSCYRRLPYLDNDHSESPSWSSSKDFVSVTSFTVFGYVLMPEHVHLFVSEPKLHSLAVTLNVLKHETSQHLKGGRQQFWQRRYYDFNVLTQAKLVEKLRYIHRNPVERGLAQKPEDWPWSSYRHWLTGEITPVEVESHWTFNRGSKNTQRPPHLQLPSLSSPSQQIDG